MAKSRFQTTQYTADRFVESAGAVVFERSTNRVCLLHYISKNEWLLPKGRRNISEHRCDAALREVAEETGLQCQLLPIDLVSRSPPAVEVGKSPDTPRLHHGVCEPFMITCRTLDHGDMKLISWFVAAIDERVLQSFDRGESEFHADLFDLEQALDIVTYETDREVVREAIVLYRSTYLSVSPNG